MKKRVKAYLFQNERGDKFIIRDGDLMTFDDHFENAQMSEIIAMYISTILRSDIIDREYIIDDIHATPIVGAILPTEENAPELFFGFLEGPYFDENIAAMRPLKGKLN